MSVTGKVQEDWDHCPICFFLGYSEKILALIGAYFILSEAGLLYHGVNLLVDTVYVCGFNSSL